MSATTTHVFQGMDTEGKTSSKVLAPPGGKSNFSLFGGGDEDVQHTNSSRNGMGIIGQNEEPGKTSGKRMMANGRGGVSQTSRDNVFGGAMFGADEPQRPVQRQQQPEAAEERERQQAPPQAIKQQTSGINPITGEALYGEQQRPIVPVRQPPGGHSSNIFG